MEHTLKISVSKEASSGGIVNCRHVEHLLYFSFVSIGCSTFRVHTYILTSVLIMTKKRWISLFVENEIGVLARISGLFSGKSYNLDSLAVGTTENVMISRMIISLTSDDQTFEQIKKQLNRSVEVIKLIDFTDTAIHMKELMFIKINHCSEQDMTKVTYMQEIFNAKMIDCNSTTLLLECVQTENRNNDFIRLLEDNFPNRVEIVRGGSKAMEAVSISDR